MLRKKFCDILHNIQQSSSCHQKYRHVLIKLYNETSFEDFESEFMRCVERLFGIDIKCKNIHVERCMEFLATFVTTLAKTQQNNSSNDDEFEIHPFLNAVIYNVLQYHKLEQVSARFRSCHFINLLLRHLGDDAHIDADIANAIQTTMIERLEDAKASVRLQAVRGLIRLQMPEDVNCPVMASLMGRLYETNAQIRKEIVESIAVVPAFIPRIIERVRDSHYAVRLAAYKKCSLIGPKLITIANRRLIVNSGFSEEHEVVRKVFLSDTLPKWLNVYNGDYVLLLKALKYDAYEEDLEETELISKKVLEVFFKSQQFETFLDYLPRDDNKLIPVHKLNTELALFWSNLVDFLRKSNDNEDYLVQIIPEMTPFCAYIEKVYEASKGITCSTNWRYLEFQQILCQLLKISKEYDYSDEVGRKSMQKLLHHMLLDGKFSHFVLTHMIAILVKINPIFDNLTIDICHIISDIHEPLIEKPPSEDLIRNNNFKLAELKLKVNILLDERDTAVAVEDYEKASKINKQLIELNENVKQLTAVTEAPKQTRTPQDDADTLCRCLDVLIATLSHPGLTCLTASLRSCKDEFVSPLLSHPSAEVFSKAFKSVALYCLLDEQMIRDHLKLICSPIFAYRLMPQYDKSSLMISIATFSDALRLFGTDIFGEASIDTTVPQNTSKRRLNSTRRLYTTTQLDNVDNVDIDVLNCEEILFILVDMLDDENQELREYAGRGLCELVKSRIIISPTIISRLVLKWFNPATERCDQKLQQLLANAIVYFAQYVKDSEEILEKAVIPILTSLGNAPSTSPLSDVNMDNVVEFLSAITFIQKSNNSHNVHKNLAFALCHKIASKPYDRCVSLYLRMLLNLELCVEDPLVLNELIDQIQLIVEDVNDKHLKRGVERFVGKLIEMRNRIRSDGGEVVANEQDVRKSVADGPSETPSRRNGIIHNVEEKENTAPVENEDVRDETILHTIIEDPDPEMGSFHDEDDTMENSKICNDSREGRKSGRLRLKPKAQEKENVNGRNSVDLVRKHNALNKSDSREGEISPVISSSVKRRKKRVKAKDKQNKQDDGCKEPENESFDDVTIESVTSSSHNSSTDSTTARKKTSRRVVVSDTSSDSESHANKSIRRSLRKKKKTGVAETK